MHQYIETVRKEIEAAAGQEIYLTSSLFLRMHQAIKYEDEGAKILSDKSEFEEIQNKALNSINTQSVFDLKNEVLGWQAGILRDISKNFYNWWLDYKETKFLTKNCFKDGEMCLTLEAVCERMGENPTEVFSALLEIEHVITRIHTSCNVTMMEIDRFWQFKYQNKKKAPINDFMKKRIVTEGKSTIISNSITIVENLSKLCYKFAQKLAGADHILWMAPYNMMEALNHILKGFLDFEYTEDAELCLTSWLDDLFPKRLVDNQPNPYYQSTLYHQIVANLSQATQCLVQETIKQNNAFEQRDNIVRPFIQETLEAVKLAKLTELKKEQQSGLKEKVQKL
ncbi:MAG: hypothetical protein OEY59_10305 [Deltaproteobacteria bacterium]|nr:hypothetical protein [Deltaproteobacteria bacterium]